METAEILEALNRLFDRVLGGRAYQLTEQAAAADIPEWDSLNHIQVITAIESHFGVEFSNQEIMRFRNLGNICATVKAKLGARQK